MNLSTCWEDVSYQQYQALKKCFVTLSSSEIITLLLLFLVKNRSSEQPFSHAGILTSIIWRPLPHSDRKISSETQQMHKLS